MSAQRVLLEAINRGVQVGADDGGLAIRAMPGALSPELRDQLKAAKNEIAEFIGPDRRLARMSFAQQRMWFIDRFTPDSPLYTATATTYRIRGPLDRTALEAAINGVVRRHETLRTVFPFVHGEPVQSIHAFVAIELPLIDFTGSPEADAMAAIDKLMQEPFDLARGPLFRPTLIRIDTREHILALPMHHIISDGWSTGVLYREIQACYDAEMRGTSPDLPELMAQYADVAEVQHQFVESNDGRKQLEYWKHQLGGEIPALDLPSNGPRSASPGFDGARERITLDNRLADDLKKIGRAEGASLFMVCLAAYYVLLHRYTRNEDIVVGSPIAGRTVEHSENLLGLFVNTAALRANIESSASLREIVHSVRDTALGAFANQDVPFEKVVAEVQPDRDLTHSPLFRVMFVLQNAPVPDLNIGEARLIPMELETGTAKFDLSLELIEREGVFHATLEYNTTVFDDAQAQCFLGQYETLLHSFAANMDRRISEIDIISPQERERITTDFNETTADFDDVRPVPVRFAEWAAERPDAPAVLWEQGSLTYSALDRAANALALKIRGAGIRKNGIVAVCAPRSPEMIAAQLAVMKAGAAFLSLDPEHPYDRLAHMVRDAGARVLLMTKDHAAEFPNIATISIDLNEKAEDAPEDSCVNPEDLAYVIYTSGSTGTPKGVAIEHRGLANLAAWHQKAFDVDENDRGSQLASPAFDASVWEIWPYLSAGAAVTICPDGVRAEPVAFRDWMLAEGVTVGFAPTDLIESLFALDWPNETRLHHLLTGGAWLAKRPPAGLPFTVVNNYGPTENSVVTTSGEVEPGTDDTTLPTIGRPIANHHVYILDDALRIAPLGVPGELYIGGAGLAREYLNDPTRTNDQFVLGPADSPNPMRLYKTGDRGRFLPDGRIQFLGRTDHQVNVRGYRVELAEIEAAAQAVDGIAEAVAAPLVDGSLGEEHMRETGLRLFVTPDSNDVPIESEAADAHVGQWRTLYDDTYAESPINIDPSLNVIGWNSSYTGAPIPVAEMREWRDCTVERLREFGPRHVLEIGCGTGMILAELASECESYTAVDFSSEALKYVRTEIVERRGLRNVELLQASADDLSTLGDRQFDLVILNSIVQYFPSVEYLDAVLADVVRRTTFGGHVFIGDVRNHALLNQFHAAVQLETASHDAAAETIAGRIRRNADAEDELLIHPAYFHRIVAENDALGSAQTLIKRGRSENELQQFRYDAVLSAGDRPDIVEHETLEWRDSDAWLQEARKLVQSATRPVRLTGIPNGRIAIPCQVLPLVNTASAGDTWGSLKQRVGEGPRIGPERFIEQFSDLPFTAAPYCNPDDPERFDVVLTPNGEAALSPITPTDSVPANVPLTNVPLEAGRLRGLAAAVRDRLQRVLPPYMVPNRIVPVASFPRTASGKPDRQALCKYDDAVPTGAQYVSPRNDLEEAVVELWRELLGVDRIGVEDNFFELGGHSLLATQLVAQIADAYGVELPLRDLFACPTPAGVADAVEQALMREIEDMTEDEAARLVAS